MQAVFTVLYLPLQRLASALSPRMQPAATGRYRFFAVAPRATYDIVVRDDSPELRAARLRTALDLCAFGESIRLAQLRRERADASDEEIAALLTAWLQTRPGAEHGDGWGRPVTWPPPRR